MSKSLGNYFTLRDLLSKDYSPEAIRYLLLSTHYRKQLNFTIDGLQQAQSSIQRLEDFILHMKERANSESPSPDFNSGVQTARERFIESLDDDINTSAGLAAVFDFVRSTYQRDSQKPISGGDAQAALDFIQEVDNLFCILRPQPEILDEEIAKLIEERQAARKNRDFAEADRIRDYLLSKDIQLEDTRDGVRWKRST
jgi:cysteinyl-tRNA synthetase